MAGPESEQVIEMLSQLFGGGARYVPVEQTLGEMKKTDPKNRAQFVLNQLLTVPIGNRMAENTLGRVRFLSGDITRPGEAVPFDWMLNRDQQERLSPNIDDLMDVTGLITFMLGVKGYGDWDSIRGRIGGAKSPAAMAMMEVWGPRGLEVTFENGPRPERRKLTLSMAKMIGKLAYTQAGIEAFNARDTDQYGSVMMRLLGEAVAESLGKPDLMSEDPAVRNAEQSKMIAADLLSQNGEPIHGFGHLLEIMSSMPFMSEGFLNVMADQMEMAQHVYGGFSNEAARSTWGSLYFIDEAQLNHQMGPEVHLLSAFGGIISQYATKGGLNWMFSDEKWAGKFGGRSLTKEGEAGNRGLRAKFMKEVVSYEPKQGEADLVEARMLQCFIQNRAYKGRQVTPEYVQEELAKIPKLARPHLRPPELWVPTARRLLRKPEYAAAWSAPDADLSTWSKKLEMPLDTPTGQVGLMEFLTKASERGVGIYEWNNFNARTVGDELRYANKVAVTAEALRAASQAISQGGANISGENPQRVTMNSVKVAGFSAAKTAVEFLGKGEKDLYKWMSLDRQNSFVMNWLRGAVRANLVPFLDDESTLLFDFDEKEFVDSHAVVVKPKKFWRREIQDELDASGRSMVDLETFMAESGMRWSVYKGGPYKNDGDERFIVNSSGRPGYHSSTSRELYLKAGNQLSIMEAKIGEMNTEDRERVVRLREFHTAVDRNGWNRFSTNWWLGYTPAGFDAMVSLVGQCRAKEVVDDGDAESLRVWLEGLSQPGDYRLIAVGAPRSLHRPLGSERDRSVGLPDPRHAKPKDAELKYQTFSAQNR